MAWLVTLCCGMLRRGSHHRVGTEADQRGRGGMNTAVLVSAGLGELVCGELVRGKACCVLAFNHTRAGTVPDRRGRCGMHFVLVCYVAAMSVKAGSVAIG